MKLNQVIAIEKGIKSNTHQALSHLYKVIQQPAYFDGMTRTYQKTVEDTEDLPAESKPVQVSSARIIEDIRKVSTDLLDVVAKKDFNNTKATADVLINGASILSNVPVTYLLFLEKQVTDLKTAIGKFPELDNMTSWTPDPHEDGIYRSEPVMVNRTKRYETPVVMYEATEHHPAQVGMKSDDKVVGYYNTTRFSGAIPKRDKVAMLDRVEALLRAVKQAREAANSVEVTEQPEVGARLFDYIING